MPEDLRNLGKHFGDVSIDSLTIEQDLIGDIGGTPTWTGEHTFDAGIRSTGSPSSVEDGLNIYFQSGRGSIVAQDGDSINSRIRLEDELVDLSISPANLRLDTGQDIEDGDGSRRFRLSSFGTVMFTPDNLVAFQGSTDNIEANAHANKDFRIFDREGTFQALRYTTSASAPGTLELTNADLDMDGQDLVGDIGGSPTWTGEHTFEADVDLDENQLTGARSIEYDRDGERRWNSFVSSDYSWRIGDGDDNYFRLYQGGPVAVEETDLRLDTGQAIEDGDGNRRLNVADDSTTLRYPDGESAVHVRDGVGTYFSPREGDGNTSRIIYDAVGGHEAVNYVQSSSSPGTLELTNADLEIPTSLNVVRDDNDSEFVAWHRAGPSGAIMHIVNQGNQVVSADTTTEILKADSDRTRGSLLVVVGRTGGSDHWTDILNFVGADSVTVISSQERGSPGSRTYSVEDNWNLGLTIGTDARVTVQGLTSQVSQIS